MPARYRDVGSTEWIVVPNGVRGFASRQPFFSNRIIGLTEYIYRVTRDFDGRESYAIVQSSSETPPTLQEYQVNSLQVNNVSTPLAIPSTEVERNQGSTAWGTDEGNLLVFLTDIGDFNFEQEFAQIREIGFRGNRRPFLQGSFQYSGVDQFVSRSGGFPSLITFPLATHWQNQSGSTFTKIPVYTSQPQLHLAAPLFSRTFQLRIFDRNNNLVVDLERLQGAWELEILDQLCPAGTCEVECPDKLCCYDPATGLAVTSFPFGG